MRRLRSKPQREKSTGPYLSDFTDSRDNNFNLLRVGAALAVIISHSFAVTGHFSEPVKALTELTLGSMAVELFFFSSGFLVTRSLLNRKSIPEYCSARVLRIYPGLILNVTLTVVILGLFFTTLPLRDYFRNAMTFRYWWKDCTVVTGLYYFLPGVFTHNPESAGVNGPLWSISFELQCYAVLAGIWWLAERATTRVLERFKVAIITIALVSAALHLFGHFWAASDDGYPQLFFMFFGGGAFYLLRRSIVLQGKWVMLITVALVFSLLAPRLFLPVYVLGIGYMILFFAYIPGGKIRAYNRLGDYSYGLYIYGFPTQQAVTYCCPGISWWKSLFIVMPVALAFAAFSWHFVEKKALRFKRGSR